MSHKELVFRTARELVLLMVTRQVSAREVLEAHLEQIERVNPAVNAVVTFVPELARRRAKRADASIVRGVALGPLHGLPVLHKDLAATKGIRTTQGSVIFKDDVPTYNTLVVQRLVDAGAVTMGKTNTPEFGTGSQTYNRVFGATRNPYDTNVTCGGSSGGAAVALACGMTPIADGSDMAGSLRNPASFCNVVGLRPSIARVPLWPSPQTHFTLGTYGPMARTVGDVALQMQVIARPDFRAALNAPVVDFGLPLEDGVAGTRVAWSATLDGLPVDPRITETLAPAAQALEDLGCRVEECEPDFSGADESFSILRAAYYRQAFEQFYEERPGDLGDETTWEIERGLELTVDDLGRAELLRSQVYDRMYKFLTEYRFLIAPVTQLPPFDVHEHWPKWVAGVKQTYYREWMRVCSRVTLPGLPALSLPFGFTPEGHPTGLQIIGRQGDDLGVLRLAAALETATGTWRQHPRIAQ
ncbi:amidase [Streptomyces sp. AV19]|uniref:amidase n=1 Tax=Streptomyces sp. AV19 TaxID=2793068 RepID=UPI0018FE200B|nr:amidase [Streptomyces sp. AV19]MBH1937691.1 amidase [Streptomyces sp. AV19]MDG4536359.1 amidase [Streptomyces sp. AV19]